jgi:hypothetical protein
MHAIVASRLERRQIVFNMESEVRRRQMDPW